MLIVGGAFVLFMYAVLSTICEICIGKSQQSTAMSTREIARRGERVRGFAPTMASRVING